MVSAPSVSADGARQHLCLAPACGASGSSATLGARPWTQDSLDTHTRDTDRPTQTGQSTRSSGIFSGWHRWGLVRSQLFLAERFRNATANVFWALQTACNTAKREKIKKANEPSAKSKISKNGPHATLSQKYYYLGST